MFQLSTPSFLQAGCCKAGGPGVATAVRPASQQAKPAAAAAATGIMQVSTVVLGFLACMPCFALATNGPWQLFRSVYQ